ncbi:MAG: class C sortase [Clostridiales bacterium]|nr:class C sortase [Clostridiales bacterium]
MKKHLSTIILILVFLTGLSLMLYPTISDWWNSFHQSKAIAQYVENVANLDDTEYEKLWKDAHSYNEALTQKADRYEMSEEEREEYESLLNVSGDGIIGYIEIPLIGCSLPIYHGTDETVLQIAVGHIEGTSLPIGGAGSHCVISGHRGLPSAKLFTNLDKLTVGEPFVLCVLDETLTYEVDQILIVKPYEMEALEIESGKDYCTLVTCTPYGINSHRLLVRGHRVETIEEADAIRVTADALQIDPMIVAPLVAVPMLLLLLIALLVSAGRKKR